MAEHVYIESDDGQEYDLGTLWSWTDGQGDRYVIRSEAGEFIRWALEEELYGDEVTFKIKVR